jgi:hypothetical protein
MEMYTRTTHCILRLSNGRLLVQVEYGSYDNSWSELLVADSLGAPFSPVPGLTIGDFVEQVIEDNTSPGTLILAVSCAGGVMRSTDYGQTWQRQLAGLPQGREDANFVYQNPHGGALYAGVPGMGVYESDDHGANWEQISMPIGLAGYWAFRFTAMGNAVYAYSYWGPYPGTSLSRANHQWLLDPPFADWRYVANTPASLDISTLLGPVVRKNGDSLFCYAIEFPNGVDSILFRTASSTNLGQSWVIGPPTTDSLDPAYFEVSSSDSGLNLFSRVVNTGLLSASVLLRSTDEGRSWSRIPIPGGSGRDPWQTIEQHDTLYVMTGDSYGNMACLIRSVNQGRTWDTLRNVFQTSANPSFVVLGNDVLTIDRLPVGDWFHLWHYSGGVWDDHGPLPQINNPLAVAGLIAVPGPHPLLICFYDSSDPDLYVSADSGHTWEARTAILPVNNQGYRMSTLTWDRYRGRLWAVTGLGVCYLDTFELAVKNKPLVFKPADYTVLSAYPNPFNSTTTIRFDLLKREKVTLDLYDVQGRLVRTLCNEIKEAGRQELRFDGEGLASGVYFVRLKSAEQTKTQKILLLK